MELADFKHKRLADEGCMRAASAAARRFAARETSLIASAAGGAGLMVSGHCVDAWRRRCVDAAAAGSDGGGAHDLAARRACYRLHGCDRSTASWSDACRGSPRLSAQPPRGTGGGPPQCSRSAWRRSREHKSTRARCDRSTARRPRRVCGS
eukprot:2932047-Prymnesium_polylepis.1